MEFRTIHVQDSEGRPISGASVYVYLINTTTEASIFDEDGDALSQPITTNSSGDVGFRAANGEYDVVSLRNGASVTVQNVKLLDADDFLTEAETARDTAVAAKDLAETAASSASASATAAESSASRVDLGALDDAVADAESAQGFAETAQAGAEAAQTAAETAQSGAVTAQGLAEAAQTSTESARDVALSAVAAAGNYYTDTTIAAAIATAEAALTAGDNYAATGDDVNYVSFRVFDDPSSTELWQQATTGAIAAKVGNDQLGQLFAGGEDATDGDSSLADSTFATNTNVFVVVGDNERLIYVTEVEVNLAASGTGYIIVVRADGLVHHVSELLTAPSSGVNTITVEPFSVPPGYCYGWRRASGGALRRGALGSEPDSFSFSGATLPSIGDVVVKTAQTYQPAVAVSGIGLYPTTTNTVSLRDSVLGPEFTAGVAGTAIAASDGASYALTASDAAYVERSGPTTVSGIGQLVGTLTDAANSYDMTAPDDASRPRFGRSLGYGPSLFFEGAQYVESTSLGAMLGTFASGMTLTVTAKPAPGASGTGMSLLAITDASNALLFYIGTNGGNYIVGPGGNVLGPVTNDPQTITVSWSVGGSYRAWINGALVVTGGSRTISGTATRVMLGTLRNGGSPTNFFSGWLGGVSVIEGALSDADALDVNLAAVEEWQDSGSGTTELAEEVKAARLGSASLRERNLVSYQGRLHEALMLGTAPVAFLLIGQSNMVGQAPWDSGTGYPSGTLQWLQAGGLGAAAIRLDHNETASTTLFGPSLQFAIDFKATYPNAQALFMPCANSGSGFSTSEWTVGGTKYTPAVRRANEVLQRYPQVVLGGIVMHQGEKDAATSNASYESQLDATIAGMRSEVITAGSFTPFVCGGIYQSLNLGTYPLRDTINAILEDTPNRIEHAGFASSDGLTTVDNIHFDAASQRTLGSRYFTAWQGALRGWLAA